MLRVRQLFFLVSLGLLAALLSPLPGQARAPTRGQKVAAVPAIPFVKYRLANGLEVILHQDRSLPLVTINVWYRVGAVDEPVGRTGFAHLFEHVMFQGSQHVGRNQHFQHLIRAGASNVNGTTSDDRTNYFQRVPSNQLDLALWLESDRMGFLLPALDQTKLDRQRAVVKNERRQRFENQPYGKARERLCQALFPSPHPYGGCVIGSMKDLSAASLDDVKQFFRTYYTPANATLCLAGDFDLQHARQRVEHYFGGLTGAPRPVRVVPPPPRPTQEERIVLHDRVRFPQVTLAWVTPALFQPGDADLDLLALVLDEGKTSRLYRSMVYDKPLAQAVAAGQQSGVAASRFIMMAVAAGETRADALEAGLWAALRQVANQGPRADELRRALNVLQTNLYRSLQSLDGRADTLQRYNLFAGDPGYLDKDMARYLKVTPATVQAAARSLLAAKGRVVIHVLPPPAGQVTP
jgi:predicted Zn-dependent peptidase